MLFISQTLKSLNVGFQTIFQKAFTEVTNDWQDLATIVPSSTSEETYGWLGNFPTMREWIGERLIQNLSTYDYSIKNKKYEMTVAVKRDDIEDDKIGIYTPLVQTMGQEAANYPADVIYGLLINGTKNKCFDGKPFFTTDHPSGKNSKKQVSNLGTEALTPESYGKARAAMMSLKNDSDKSLKLRPNLLIVPPALEGMALKIVEADFIEGSTNIYKGTAKVKVVPELAGNDTTWYLADTTRPLKPLIWQNRKDIKFVAKDSETDDNLFDKDEIKYGVDARGNAGYGFWQMMYCSKGA